MEKTSFPSVCFSKSNAEKGIVAQIKRKQKFSLVRLAHKEAPKQDERMKNQMIVAISTPSSL